MAAMRKARISLSERLIETGLLRSKGLIDGKWLPAASGLSFQVNDPASDIAVAAVSAYGAEDTKLAVSAAEKSFGAWRSKTMQVKRIEEATCSPIHILRSAVGAAVGVCYVLGSRCGPHY